MSQNAIEVKELCKVYRLYENPMDRLKESLKLTRKVKHTDHFALDNVNFTVKKGETVGIIGTNGSGKSTILKIITGVLNPTSGEVNVDGRISALLELGAGFNQEYTGLENVYLNGTMIGFTREEIDKRLGLESAEGLKYEMIITAKRNSSIYSKFIDTMKQQVKNKEQINIGRIIDNKENIGFPILI